MSTSVTVQESVTVFNLLLISCLFVSTNVVAHHHRHHQHRYPLIVHPRVIPSPELLSRDRRSLPKIIDRDVQYVSLHRWILKTKSNGQLKFSSKFNIEWRGSSATKFSNKSFDSCESREGYIHRKETKSRVLLTRCDGEFFALVNLQNVTYLMEPLLPDSGEHLLYEADYSRVRREVSTSASFIYEGSRRFFNLSGDTFDAENYHDNPELMNENTGLGRNHELERLPEMVNNDDDDPFGYYYGKNWMEDRIPGKFIDDFVS